MATDIAELTTRVRDWLNRDTAVISDTVIQNCLEWAADDVYKKLRITELEQTQLYTGIGTGDTNIAEEPNVGDITVSSILVPDDLLEIIKIRTTDVHGQTIRVIETRMDQRTFFNPYGHKYSVDAGFTRKGDRLYISAAIGGSPLNLSAEETYVELHYYKRFKDLDAVNEVSSDTFDTLATYIELADTQTGAPSAGEGLLRIVDSLDNPVTDPTAESIFVTGNVAEDVLDTEPDAANGVHKFKGKLPYNWLINDNEKLLMFGALAEAFAYLQEDDQAAKYTQKFAGEILSLNDFDARSKRAAGGNVQVNFSSSLI